MTMPERAVVLLVVFILATSCGGPVASTAQGAGATPPQASSPATAERAVIQQYNDSLVQAELGRLGALQNDPAGTVFINLKLPQLQTVPARTLLAIMNGGYARALGVTCAHCHDVADFSSDVKRPKLAAREMARMHRMINQELAKMPHLATPPEQNRAINCMMCHRGMVNPR
jgi:hypothetical protein